MELQKFFQQNNGVFNLTRQQGSDFAKQIANDFNPLHDVDSKRFVVPGDFLFSLVLQQKGISQNMKFDFSGMVTDETRFNINANHQVIRVEDDNKVYTSVEISGDTHTDADFISTLSQEYVKFSGETFPHILVPLMRDKGLMINPARPMVMYQSMAIHLDEFPKGVPVLEMANQEFETQGKRGNVTLHFNVLVDGKVIGRGEKQLLLSGLREFEEAAMAQLTNDYDATKSAY